MNGNNYLYLIVPSNLNNETDVIRFAKSVDISNNIVVFLVNQSVNKSLSDVYEFKLCRVKEYKTNGIVPLSKARNIALSDMYKDSNLKKKNSLVMFVDDDAWFPEDTIRSILSESERSRCLRTIDPICKKSFNGLSYTEGEVKGWHLVHDICSICLVVPYSLLEKERILFNTQLGLGNNISQGEESLFIYELHKKGIHIFYDAHYIYHPYKLSNNIKNYYSLSYFWTWGTVYVSRLFAWPCVKYLMKYTLGLGLFWKSERYPQIFSAVWRGALDGARNKELIKYKN